MSFYKCDDCGSILSYDEMEQVRVNLTYEYGAEGPDVYKTFLSCPCGSLDVMEYQDYEVEEVVEMYVELDPDEPLDKWCSTYDFDKDQLALAHKLYEEA